MTETPSSTRRIERALAQLGSEHEPPAGWEAYVFAKIAQERLEGELARLGEGHEPPLGWQDRVLAVTAARPIRRWRAAAMAGFGAAAAITVVILVMSWKQSQPVMLVGDTQPLEIELRTKREGPAERGSLSIGAIVYAEARGGDPHRALWVYRDDRLAAACPGDIRCHRSETEIVVELSLEMPGMYRFVALASRSWILPPRATYDQDLADAQRRGAHIKQQTLEAR